ncbi:Ig-like domain-containing protein [Lachnospiraceae bacterium 46-15]
MERKNRECVKRWLAFGLALILLLGGVSDRTVFVWAAKGSSEASVHQGESGKMGAFSDTGEAGNKAKQLTDDMVSPIGEQVYDGQKKCPVILVTDISENRILEENTDYTASYTDNINASEHAAVVITGMGNYTGKVTRTFRIRPQEVSADNIALADSEGIYTGTSQTITVLAPFADGEVFYYRESAAEENRIDEIVDVGSYKVWVKSADSNYTGAAELDYHVLPKHVFSDSITVTYDRDTVLTYNGQVQRPVVMSVRDGERELSEGGDYEVAYGDGDFLSRGTYTVTISGKGNYQGSADGVFVIQNGSVDTDTVAFELEGMGYQAGYYRSDVTVKVEGYELSEEEEDEESYTEFLVYEDTLKEDKEIYLKDVDTEEILGPMVLEKDAFTILKDVPEVRAVIDASTDSEEWTTEKRIELPEPEEDVKYYYSSEPCALTAINTDRDLEGLTAIEGGAFQVDAEVGEAAEVYYIYAVDRAGNIAEVTVDVRKIDHTAPTVQTLKNHAHYDVENDVFWKNAEDLRVSFDASDDRAGIESVSIRPEEGAKVNQEEGAVTFAVPGDYTITVRDRAGNSASVNVAVRQDTEVPGITTGIPREASDGGEIRAYDDGDVCWVNRDSVRLPFEITDMEDEDVPGIEDGTYTSQVFMMAAQKPELTEFSMTGVTDTRIDGAAVYHKGRDGAADVNLEFSVMDTPEGWSEENLAENVTLEIFNLSVSNSRPSVVLKGNELNWTTHGNIYCASYGLSGEGEPANYKASISYKNKLGNMMVRAESFQGAGEFDEARGVYIGEEFILDHKPPYYTVSYNAADRLVKEGDTGADNDKKESKPEAGYTAYYKKNIEVMLTVEEDYAAAFEQGEDSCFGLCIIRDGKELEELPDISWTHQGNIHTGTFRLAEEGSYEIFLRYRDAAGNEMEPKLESPDSEKGRNSIKDGYQYRSPVLVIDKTAPQIETAYVNESGSVIAPSALVDGRSYFRENVYLQVKVKDKNVRCHEFKDALLNTEGSLSVCDSVGDAVPDDSITEFFNGNSFNEESVISDEVMWKIPLFRQDDAGYGANYDLTLRCEDLAGNGAAGTGLDNKINVKVTFDGSAPEQDVFIGFESDVLGANSIKAELMEESEQGWVSKVLDFFSGCWLKIFGKEKIKFRMYARDTVSGIRTVSMSYKKNGGNAVVFDTGSSGKTEAHIRILSRESDRKEEALLAGYMLLEGEFTVEEEQDISIHDFTVEGIRDYAGNVRRVDDKGRAFVLRSLDESADLLYLDRKAPVLDSSYPDGGALEEEYKRVFYKDTVTLSYMLTERFYLENIRNGSVVTPRFSIQGENRNAVQVTPWTPAGIKGYDASAEVCFPAGRDCEQEYLCTVSYQDVAENLLTAGESCRGTAEGGVYTEYAVIVDHVAPKLMKFEIDGQTNRTVSGGIPVYHNDAGKDDVTIKFTVDDNDAYWKPETLVFEIYSSQGDGQEACVRLTGEQLVWETDGRNHSTAYGFDGVPGMAAGRYYVKVSYRDRAGNHMVSGSTGIQGKFSEGIYSSREFVLDHTAPIFNISYSGARRVVSSDTSSIKDSTAKTPQTGYVSYYNDKIDVEFSITEHHAVEENGKLVNQDSADTDFLLRVIKDGKVMAGADMPEVRWTKAEAGGIAVYKAQFTLRADGRYQISVSYRDTAMNAMTAGRQVQGSNTIPAIGQNGTYTSTQLVLDTHAPVVSFAYVDASTKKKVEPQAVGEKTGRKYFNRPVYFQIKVDDTRSGAPGSGNIRYQELKKALALTAAAADGKALKGFAAKAAVNALDARRTVNGEFVIELPMTDEANYDAALTGFEDLAGNQAAVLNAKTCVDRTKPEAELSCKLSSHSGFADALRYGKNDIWFADSTLLVTAAVKDATAGVREIMFTLKDTDDDGKTLYKTKTYHPPETIKWKKAQSFTVQVPLETADFDGTVTARVTDWSGCTYTVSQASVIESKKRHKSTSTARITTKTKPSRVVGGVDYYNSDVEFEVSLKDSYSGIHDYKITPGKDQVIEKNFGSGEASAIRRSLRKTVRLSSADNNQNDVNVTARYTDNANHKASVKQQYNIDITPPVIQVEYNLNDAASEKYYKDTRVATVTITERNFDPADVEFTITNTDGVQPAISDWSASGSGDDTQNVCTITYSEDGDYSFTVSFQDKAGNRAEYNQVDEFTIDQTAPTYTVTYDNNDAENGHYYKRGRTATIDVEEHNFEASNVAVSITKDGASADALLSGWSSNGDHNIATVPFDTDGEYTLSISGADRAENEMEAYSGDHFVVDMTKPEVEIQNVENKSANSGVVAPRIVYNDTNYDASRTEIIYEGYHNGKLDYSKNSTTTTSARGAVIAMKDIARVQKNDDMYTIKVTVYDKAGNKSDEVKKVFSVNRFGSVYTFDDAQTKMLLGGDSMGYTNTAQDLKIRETNVDTLKFKEITCSHDGMLLPMQEGEEYTVAESGNDVTWKQYTYMFHKDNFEKQGRYILKIMSGDRAENLSDNDTKGKKIQFVMDTTSPSALISGVEDNGRYQASRQDVTVDVQDNTLLGRVQMYTNGELVADYTDIKELSELNGRLSQSIEEQDYAQSFKVVATDAAGNSYTAEVSNIVITTDWWRLFLANKPLFYGSIVAALGAAALLWITVLARKRKHS